MTPTPSLLHSRTLPIAVLLTTAAFIGCGTPSYHADENPYYDNPRIRLPYKPETAGGGGATYVGPLGIRRPRADGDVRVDILLSGPCAFELAQQWSDAPRHRGTANAVVSIRRVSPDAVPLSVRFAGAGVDATPLDENGKELYRGISRGDNRVMLTLILESSPSFSPGHYEFGLLIPQGEQATAWSIGDTTIALDRRTMGVVITNSNRIEPEMMMAWP